MLVARMSAYDAGDYANSQQSYFPGGVPYNRPPRSTQDGPRPSQTTSASYSQGFVAWTGANLAQDIDKWGTAPVVTPSQGAIYSPATASPMANAYAHLQHSMTPYSQQWSYSGEDFTDYPSSQGENTIPLQHNDGSAQIPSRRDSDSQWSQMTSADASTTSSIQDPAAPKKAQPRSSTTTDPSPQHRPKTWSVRPHSIIEKKYRENLNNKIWQLHGTLVETNRLASLKDVDATSSGKTSKSEIICNAIRYVNQMELNCRHMEEQIAHLTEKIDMLEAEAE